MAPNTSPIVLNIVGHSLPNEDSHLDFRLNGRSEIKNLGIAPFLDEPQNTNPKPILPELNISYSRWQSVTEHCMDECR